MQELWTLLGICKSCKHMKGKEYATAGAWSRSNCIACSYSGPAVLGKGVNMILVKTAGGAAGGGNITP
jgi:hypothetical protein